MTTELNVKGYVPLSQSISNTDTEDEDDEHHDISVDPKDLEEVNTMDSPMIYNNGRFLPLDESKNFAGKIRNGQSLFGSSNDNIPIMILDGQMDNDLWKRRDMPLIRRFFLTASILMCILTIVMFLYALPCEGPSICCSSSPKPKTSISWDKTLDGVEIHGKITVIPSHPSNLIFLLRGQQFGSMNVSKAARGEQMPLNGGGVLSMQGTNGIALWWVKLKCLPTDINCEMIDTDRSGKSDCLISGLGGLLVSIDPIAGTIHWNSEVHTHPELPLIYVDVDNDGVSDLISIEVTESSPNLVLLSGKSGKLIGGGRQPIPGCQTIKLYNVDSFHNLTYGCVDAVGNHSNNAYSMETFVKSLQPALAPKKVTLSTLPVPNIITYPSQISKDAWDLTPFHRLHVQNLGECPSEDCRTAINLTQVSDFNETHIWNLTMFDSFVSKPAILDVSTKNFTTGFALKFWQWAEARRSKDSMSVDAPTNNLTERVLIIFVGNNEVNEINASQRQIVQVCHDSDCQPNLARQVLSLATADLNGDGVFELISYSSTYEMADELQSFTSRVQIVKLDEIFDTKV